MIRKATLQDTGAILALSRASFVVVEKDDVALSMSIGEGNVDVAEDEGRVVGYVESFLPLGRTTYLLNELAVARGDRGRGWGRKLAERALERAEGRRVRLYVSHDNEVAKRLYVSLGFEEIGRAQGGLVLMERGQRWDK